MIQHLLLAIAASQQSPACARVDSTSLSSFVTQFIAQAPPAERVQRGAFVLVCGERIVVALGIGTARNGAPVNPERTLFRAASNSKLITATAAMQLAASGRWKLTDEVNAYLPPAAKLANGFGRQVTIADLLTHTAGLDDKFAGSIVQTSQQIPLAEFFARNRPVRVRPAGVEVSYSNIGIALTGYAVEVATKESFADYAATHIFAPLGMTHSTFAQPPPTAWRDDAASAPAKGARDIAFLPYPAASLVTTPMDMGRFITAHLSGGATHAGRILSASSIREMHASHWRVRSSVPAVAYGFFEGELNGHRVLFHTGDSGDHSVVFLLPDDDMGLYFVFSASDEQTVVREKLVRAFMDRYFPRIKRVIAPSDLQSTHEFDGIYRGAAYSRTNYEKLKAMFYQLFVRDVGGGVIEVTPPGGGTPVHLTNRAPDVFVGDSGEIVVFRRDAHHTVTGFTLTGSIWDPQSFDRIGALQDGRLHVAAFGFVALTFLARIVFTPVAAAVRRIRRRPKPQYSVRERRWWNWSGAICAMVLVTPIVGIGVAFLSFRPGPVAIPRAASFVGVWLTLVMIAGLTLVPVTLVAWRRHYWSTPRRTVFTGVALGVAIGSPLLAFWRVIP
ncbi:MAG: serine hydrolase domain-containing protein [bacterium]